jgi:hypothetical protein
MNNKRRGGLRIKIGIPSAKIGYGRNPPPRSFSSKLTALIPNPGCMMPEEVATIGTGMHFCLSSVGNDMHDSGMRVGLSYRVPPATMSRELIAHLTCDCVTCPVRNWEG